MPKTRKTLQPKNLAKYDVYIEDRTPSSDYFNVTNLPQVFTGGRNSFLLAGSTLLKPQSNIQIEILDSKGNPIFQNPIKNYVQGNSILISLEINEFTAPGFATIILMGQAVVDTKGTVIPTNWQDSYNVRWTKKVLVEPNLKNSSPLILEDTPVILVKENRLYSVQTSSYVSSSTPFTSSLFTTLYSGYPIGYTLLAEFPTTFSADYFNAYITGTLNINDNTQTQVFIPINDILNETTAFSTGQLINTGDGRVIDKLYLYSGSYNTTVLGDLSKVTSSVKLIYNKLNTSNVNIPISYARLRLGKLNTVSGEIYKLKVYSKVATELSDYKLIADVPVVTSELLTTASIRGNLPIGDFNISPYVSSSWYSTTLSTGSNTVYTVSGSPAYYVPTVTFTPLELSVSDDVLLRSIRAEVPTSPITPLEINTERALTSSIFTNTVSESGYFIGNRQSIQVFPTTEYTLQFDAVYKKVSASINLVGITPKVDIYIIGTEGSTIVNENPLGQNIGTLTVNTDTEFQWYQDKQFNFIPAITSGNNIGIRFVVTNGFWYFSEVSLKPAADNIFSPDEVEILIPNTEYHNEYLQHKVEFFDINNNSTNISVISTPTFFTGSNIDLGTLK